jgi:hypothetical protein
MQTRAVRIAFVALLLIAGAGAALFTWDNQLTLGRLLAAERDVDARLDRLGWLLTALGDAQQNAVLPGQNPGEWLARGASLLSKLDQETSALATRTQSAVAVAALTTFNEAMAVALKNDARAREHLAIGQELMAADLTFSEGRPAVEAMSGAVRELQRAERDAAGEARRALEIRGASVAGGFALLWMCGLLALARIPPPAAQATTISAASTPAPQAAPPPRSVDMAEAASICSGLSRLTDASQLKDLLARTARVLDAAGIVVWLGAGEELFAAMAHGYHPRVLDHLGAIPRSADNATAAAWRSGAMRTVGGDGTSNGALAAPLFGPHGCVGVLAVELRQRRERDEMVRAVTTMIAAQLAAIVAAWPAPSAGYPPVETAAPGAGYPSVDSPAEGNSAAAATA